MMNNFTKVVAATVALSVPANSASADIGKVIIGAAVGGIIGCATGALNCKGQKRSSGGGQKTYRKPQLSQAQIAQRAENKRVQSALNAFGYNVGTADGVFGKNTRRGIGAYQSALGFPGTGELTDYQRQFLLDSHNRAQAQGAYMGQDTLRGYYAEQNPQWAAANGFAGNGYAGNGYAGNGGYTGNTGYDANTGYAGNNGYTGNAGYTGNTGYAGNTGNTGGYGTVTTPQVPQTAPTVPGFNTAKAEAPAGLPPLMPKTNALSASASMSDRCDLVDLLSQSNGVIQASNITDPDQALSEQFCGMRGYAMGVGDQVMTEYGLDAAAAESQFCGPISNGMMAVSETVATAKPEEIAAKAAAKTQELAVTDADTARALGTICMSVGYRQDDPSMAMGGALMMIGQGDYAYSEVLGHHLREGFGMPANAQAADPWYRAAIATLEQGGTPAFLPAQSANRTAVMRGALDMGATASSGSLPGVVPVSGAPVLPVLKKQ
ncbi:peptidoglycan-binding domain-containing protein [Pseudooceanicola sp. C21-150M6]|uniref:peptidoglycan-binding domain-containing protein n=1 Tax=Pseudooceanicola sp. C21-150M6 TaxID=3434355 RepID=UPI003D7F29F0